MVKPTKIGIAATLLLALACKHAGSGAATVKDSDLNNATNGNNAGLVDAQPEHYDCNTLDTGIYWYGKGNVAIKATDGTPSAFYDPKKPTVIYVHGWQNGDYKTSHRENFAYTPADTKATIDTAAAWADAGWNIGIFYWHQFADETDLKTAEAKIWTTQGPGGTRWKKCDGTFSTEGSPQASMGELFYRTYVTAMQGYAGPNVRIVGHGLGNQMAARLADLVSKGVAAGEVDAALMPKRVALVDPYWTMGLSVDPQPGAQVRAIVTALTAQGTLVEWYKDSGLLNLGSPFGQGDFNTPMISIIGQTKPILGYISSSNPATQEAGRHVAAPRVYFWSYAFPAPTGCAPDCDQQVPSAAMSDDDLAANIRQGTVWLQTSGADTSDPRDDVYTKQ